jgi:hydrogenase expression/formation protein HypE
MSQDLLCPLPLSNYPAITLGHGGGGRLTQNLIEGLIRPALSNPILDQLHDGAEIALDTTRIAFTTDSFVVSPRWFPGGDIGSLAIHGTINDLAMCGARPLALSAALVLEEGLSMEELTAIINAMQQAAAAAGVPVVTGDTKVVDRGKGDGIFITTSGIGLIRDGITIAPTRAQPGDCVLVSGTLANHGIAIMSIREGLEFETAIVSDSAALHTLVDVLLNAAGTAVHVLRDPTRGGVASALNEIAAAGKIGIRLDERAIPLEEEVRGACEILGLDPLYVANEGRFLAIVARDACDAALAALRAHPLGRDAVQIGEVCADHPGMVVMRSQIGGTRVVEMLSGEQLPRIC